VGLGRPRLAYSCILYDYKVILTPDKEKVNPDKGTLNILYSAATPKRIVSLIMILRVLAAMPPWVVRP